MKSLPKILAEILLIGAGFQAGAQGVRLETGDSFFFTFSSLEPFVLPDTSVKPSDQVAIALLFGLHGTGGDPFNPEPTWKGDGFGTGEQATVSFFENRTSLQPFFGTPIRGEFSRQGVAGYYDLGPAQRHWTDHEGSVRIHMDSGSMELTAIQIDVSYDAKSFRSAFDVPEPSAITLILGCLSLSAVQLRPARKGTP